MKQVLKRQLFRLLGQASGQVVVVTFAAGAPETVRQVAADMRERLPTYPHLLIRTGGPAAGARTAGAEEIGAEEIVLQPAGPLSLLRQLRQVLGGRRIGLAAVPFTPDPGHGPLRLAAYLAAPGKVMAYSRQLDRLHLHLNHPLTTALVWAGVSPAVAARRPRWWPRRQEVSRPVFRHTVLNGRPWRLDRPRVALLTPYSPYPLSHGGAVRIFNLLQAVRERYDVTLFLFASDLAGPDRRVLRELCNEVVIFPQRDYREPRWATLRPPEVCEFEHDYVRMVIAKRMYSRRIALLQVEYTQLSAYDADVLVEHDITFDLYRQVRRRRGTPQAWWDWFRWRRWERAAARRYRRVVTMSAQDARQLPGARTVVVPNGVDTDRFTPAPEPAGAHLLFVGSFRHFPNIDAFRFFLREVWPLLRDIPGLHWTVVAGPDPALYWERFSGEATLPQDPQLTIRGFVADVRPLYEQCQVVLVPTVVSAGTNLKVLEAMACQRAVVSTTSGCNGLDVTPGENVMIADRPAVLAEAIRDLLEDGVRRRQVAAAGRALVEAHYDWRRIAERQVAVWDELLAEKQREA